MALHSRALAFVATSFLASGCSLLGASSIENGRAAYNNAIVATNAEQVLNMMVRMRYGEPTGLLTVSSVTASLHIQGTVGSEFGIGSNSNYAGNLTPLSAGIAYEENPTISYTPVEGEKYMRQLMSPLPLELTMLLLGSTSSSPQVMTLLLRSINGAQNPDFVADPAPQVDPRFQRIVELLVVMSRGGRLIWAQESSPESPYVVALSGEGDLHLQQVGELYRLLGLAAPQDPADFLTLPVEIGIGKPTRAAIRLRTRSLFDLLGLAAGGVEVPADHLESGLAPRLPQPGPAGQSMRIHTSRICPGNALIAIRHHGYCYSIAATDTASKLTFRLMEALMSTRMADSVGHKPGPVLTVGVSR